ncbi:autorepressor SdpR family transcription factor [Roseimicrobium sp. ORNL1]|uniref:autorepressor SdpR family transcription factor n=1 Tax=Roseimicrobium sp. ORNL1 TaxID=2711231 RepID=UPI0013E13894|nr:autorepressor SdpR family transcription factor [Roseimicrobium sp. ORNL1]QIF04238.1 winged helix-turn-helix transcriptional regulator [Roseimicrobium sp. ORNL1]
MTALFQALNDDTRRAILDLLRQGDLSAGAIAEHFKLGKPTVSHHLDLLKRAGLVTSEKQGQFVIYTLSTSVLEDALRWILTLTKGGTPATPTSNGVTKASSSKTKTTQIRHENDAQKGMAASSRHRSPVRVSRRRLATDS